MQKNWNDIVNDLLLLFNQTELEELTGVKQAVISKLSNGHARPNMTYDYGIALDNAHKSNIKKINKAKLASEVTGA